MNNYKNNRASRKIRIANTKAVANSLLNGSLEYVWLKDVSGKPVKTLVASLHKNETIFLSKGGEVNHDSKRHSTKLSSSLEKGRGKLL